MIHLGDKSSLALRQVSFTKFQPAKSEFPFSNADLSSKELNPTTTTSMMMIVRNNKNKDNITIQQRSKRHCPVHLRDDPTCFHRDHESISPIHTQEHHDDDPHGVVCGGLCTTTSKNHASIVEFSKNERWESTPTNSVDYASSSSSSSRQSNACSKRPSSILLKNKRTSTPRNPATDGANMENDRDKEDYNHCGLKTFSPAQPLSACTLLDAVAVQQHHQQQSTTLRMIDPTTDRLFRRKAAVPTQLLKWAFAASMSLYDHLGDDDEENDQSRYQDEKEGVGDNANRSWCCEDIPSPR